MSDQLIVYQPQETRMIMPTIPLDTIKRAYQDKKEFINSILRNDVDYGVIPGTDKKTLLKPGAEKMVSFFSLSPDFTDIEKVEDWTGANHNGEPFFYYRVKCSLYNGEWRVASADGSCNSWEKKYRYRNGNRRCPECGAEAIFKSKNEPGFFCWNKKGGCGAKFAANDKRITDQELGQVINPDISDSVNTILKMAQKRALIAATLIATGTSEYFTQDMEDFVDETHAPQPAPAKKNVDTATGEIFDEPQFEQKQPPAKKQSDKKWNNAKVSIETAKAEKSSDGDLYWDMETKDIVVRLNSLITVIEKNGLAPADKESKLLKRDVLQAILQYRNS